MPDCVTFMIGHDEIQRGLSNKVSERSDWQRSGGDSNVRETKRIAIEGYVFYIEYRIKDASVGSSQELEIFPRFTEVTVTLLKFLSEPGSVYCLRGHIATRANSL